MTLSADTVVDQGTRTAGRVVGEQAVVVVIDVQKLHTLNDVGTRVWELATRSTLGDIAARVAQEYEVGEAQALADVLVFAEALIDKGVLEVVPDP